MKAQTGHCSQCDAPRPDGCTVTCGKSKCQESEHLANAARVKTPRRTRPDLLLVYRVVDDGDTVRVQCIRVKAVHKNGDIVLARPFDGSFGVKYKSTADGLYLSEQSALDGYEASNSAEIDRANRTIARSSEAIAWVREQRARIDSKASVL